MKTFKKSPEKLCCEFKMKLTLKRFFVFSIVETKFFKNFSKKISHYFSELKWTDQLQYKNMFGVIFDLLNYNSVSQIINLISKNVIQNKIPNSWLSDKSLTFHQL